MGTPGQLAMFTDPVDLGDSVVAQTGPRIGIGTTSPVDYLHVAFNDPFGAFAGLAVQNLSGGATAASGMLFYDQNGALTQFQGFNNSTHAYVINNIAKNTSNQFDGSIRFAIGSSTPSLTVASNGLVGIGTTTPTFAALSVISPSYKVGIYATGGAATDAGGAPGIIASGGDSGSIGGEAGAGLIATGGSDLEGVGGIGAVISAGSGRPDLGSGTAAIFHGDVTVVGNMLVAGTLVKNAGSFRIDHPLDPAHKYLSHSFVESPDMKNVYDGIAVLDANGVAWVELPEWFEALNRDFRYQLTALGVPAPGLFIASEVQRNHFEIAGGQPGARVSWMITGIRQDPYANAHRIPVEEAKPENEQGSYLNPDLYGQPRGALEQSRRK